MRPAAKSGEESSVRPSRASDAGDVFGATEGSGAPGNSGWDTANADIVGDMRAHLGRRKLREGADLITSGRGPLGSVVAAVSGVLRSRYLRNVRRSLLLAVSMWSWYVFNTKTYVRPEYED